MNKKYIVLDANEPKMAIWVFEVCNSSYTAIMFPFSKVRETPEVKAFLSKREIPSESGTSIDEAIKKCEVRIKSELWRNAEILEETQD